jgi:TonB family protein
MMFALLALLTPAEVPAAPAVPPPEPAPLPTPDYLSELSRAKFDRALFDRPVKAKANLVALFSTKDYPLDAIRKEQQGTVAVVVKVAVDGRVADCIISASSGSPSLDWQTCRIIWQRARFTPARDSRGTAVESALYQRIRWELPRRDMTPIKPWSTRFTLEFVKDGGAIDCKLETTGAMKGNEESCNFGMDMWEGMLSIVRSDAGYERHKLVFYTSFAPDIREVKSIEPEGTRLITRQVARLTIDASGKPLQCRVLETEGYKPPVEGCDDLLEGMYEKPDIQSGAIEATFERAVYSSH